MATPERLVPSRRLRTAAAAERDRLHRQLERLEGRAAVLRSELGDIESEVKELRDRLAIVEDLAGDEEPRAVGRLQAVPKDAENEPPHGVLKGADIRIAAVRILVETPAASAPVHYTAWYELVREAGYGVSGRDPLATFLTQITRSPVVQRAGEAGVYALDFNAPQRLRTRLRTLHEELAQLHIGQQTLEDITTVRERRLELTAEYDRVEQQLSEAVQALGLVPGER